MDYVWYFAYGSNMNLEQMKYRCPLSKPLGHGRLRNWELVERTFADIEPAPRHVTHGLLWLVHPLDMKNLDHYEGVAGGHYKRILVNVEFCGDVVAAVSYRMTEKAAKKNEPYAFSNHYREGCRRGALDNGVPVHPIYKTRNPKRNEEVIVA